jgi:hypothetical protein
MIHHLLEKVKGDVRHCFCRYAPPDTPEAYPTLMPFWLGLGFALYIGLSLFQRWVEWEGQKDAG